MSNGWIAFFTFIVSSGVFTLTIYLITKYEKKKLDRKLEEWEAGWWERIIAVTDKDLEKRRSEPWDC